MMSTPRFVGSISFCLLTVLGVAAWAAEPKSTPAGGGPGGSGGVSSVAAGIPTDDLSRFERLDFRRVIHDSKGKVFPAVVFIKCVSENYDSGKRVVVESSGSGVIISPKGEVVTNWHVVNKAISVRCLLQDGQAYKADVIGTDQDTDLGVLRLQRPADAPPLPFAEFGDSSKLTEGQFVMAMGAPWGLSRSVSMGILSCTRRYLPSVSEYSLWLQTDAAISPGNSGGPLVDTDGRIIGINARGMMAGGDMGFAIPSVTAQAVISQIREHGKVNWSWTGLQLQPIKDFNRDAYFEGTDGVIVADTDPDSPAKKAGILSRDRILRINGVKCDGLMEEDLPDIRRLLGLLPKGKEASVDLLRDGKPMTIALTPREKGKVTGEELDCPRWDLTLKQINQFENADLYFHRKEGVFVHATRYPGNAAQSGLQSQDIILKIGKNEVKTLEEAKALHKSAVDGVGQNHKLLLTVLRNGLMKQVVLDFSRDYSKE